MKKYIILFDMTDGGEIYYSTLKGDFCPTIFPQYATQFDSEKGATKAADEIMNNPAQGRDFERYTIYERSIDGTKQTPIQQTK